MRCWTPSLVLLLGWLVATPVATADPRIDYMLECQGCHLSDGSGSPGAVPDLRNSLGRFLRVPGGRAYLVRVPGSATSPLSDADLAAVLNWMIARFDPASARHGFEAYQAAEVGRLRGEPLVEVEVARAELLRALEALGPREGGALDEEAGVH